jgi:diaminohydroxyphosphoribosylaminopyrimidine deaminase/5-amino-6-(5-phosphoribosylamino)uracil reductase
MDAVVVGVGTAELDDPLLTCREAEKLRTATRVVLCGSRAPGPESKLVQTCGEGPVLLAHVADCPPPGLEALAGARAPGPGCGLLPLPAAEGRAGHVCPRALLRALAGRGASNVLVEGGREVLGSFFDNGLVDRVMAFIAPIVLGGSEAVTAVGGTGAETVALATGFLGEVHAGDRHADGDQTAHTCVRQVGRDVLIEGWTSDPLQWGPSGPREGRESPEC